mmetsp:Transcript_46381/g.143138  ORF Transcript_46381/g.143138 Transcript_46381/m.143138 type:complete len:322 (+) Transcript_46381:2516-3481(+)
MSVPSVLAEYGSSASRGCSGLGGTPVCVAVATRCVEASGASTSPCNRGARYAVVAVTGADTAADGASAGVATTSAFDTWDCAVLGGVGPTTAAPGCLAGNGSSSKPSRAFVAAAEAFAFFVVVPIDRAVAGALAVERPIVRCGSSRWPMSRNSFRMYASSCITSGGLLRIPSAAAAVDTRAVCAGRSAFTRCGRTWSTCARSRPPRRLLSCAGSGSSSASREPPARAVDGADLACGCAVAFGWADVAVETRAKWALRFGPAFLSAVTPLRAGHDVTMARSGIKGGTPARRRELFDDAVSVRGRDDGTTRADLATAAGVGSP